MIFAPSPIGKKTLDEATLKTDKQNCLKYGPCGVGRQALYLGGRFLDRRYYIPWKEVKRVFKRVAMSPGGFSGKGTFGSMAFLVVQFGSEEKECPFKFEADVDRLLTCVEQKHPDVPTHSVKAQNKLAKAEAAEQARYLKELSPEAAAAVETLAADRAFLELTPSSYSALTNAARQKRVADNLSPTHRIVGLLLSVLGAAAVLFGLYGLLTHLSYAMYFIIGGGAAFFMALSSNTAPTKWNSRKYQQQQWDAAVEAMRGYLKGRPDFSLPPQYAHPTVINRMIRVLREGRAQTIPEALVLVKEDLRALNSSVRVTQKEHDEVVEIKPLFLVCDYRDEI